MVRGLYNDRRPRRAPAERRECPRKMDVCSWSSLRWPGFGWHKEITGERYLRRPAGRRARQVDDVGEQAEQDAITLTEARWDLMGCPSPRPGKSPLGSRLETPCPCIDDVVGALCRTAACMSVACGENPPIGGGMLGPRRSMGA